MASRLSEDDRETLRLHDDACLNIGKAIVALNYLEQSLDHVIIFWYRMEASSLTMLPLIDFRSKMSLLRGVDTLDDIITRETIKRMHALYDKRNVIAHGYLLITPEGDPKRPSDGSSFFITHARRSQTMTEHEVAATTSEAVELTGVMLAATEEIEGFIHPLMELRKEFPDLSPKEFVAHLGGLIAEAEGQRDG